MKALVLSLISCVLFGSISLAAVGEVNILNHPPYPPPPGDNVINVYTVAATTQSCVARASNPHVPDDVAAKYFQINDFTIYWGDTQDDLYVSKIRIEIRHPLLKGGVYKTELAGAELASMGGYAGAWNGWIPRAYPGTRNSYTTYCGPIAGGIEFAPNGDVDFVANGYVTVVGYRRDFRGYELPISFGAQVNVINQGPH